MTEAMCNAHLRMHMHTHIRIYRYMCDAPNECVVMARDQVYAQLVVNALCRATDQIIGAHEHSMSNTGTSTLQANR